MMIMYFYKNINELPICGRTLEPQSRLILLNVCQLPSCCYIGIYDVQMRPPTADNRDFSDKGQRSCFAFELDDISDEASAELGDPHRYERYSGQNANLSQ